MIWKGRLTADQKNRLGKLLNMMYTTKELADEIGFTRRQIYRVYIPLGMPYKKDNKNRIWINGIEFKNWVSELHKKRKMTSDEAYCLVCKKVITMNNPEIKETDSLKYYLCACPDCGKNTAKIITRGK